MSNTGRPQDAWKNRNKGRPQPPGSRQSNDSGKWFVVALVVMALAGAGVGLLVYLWPDPPPVLLAVPVTAYDDPDWPPNPWADADASGFLERAGGEVNQTFQSQEKGRILAELNRVADSEGKQPVVVYLSALGIVRDGQVHLIPGKGIPTDPTSWLPLKDVLSPLSRANVSMLLVLDVRPVNDPRAPLTATDVNVALDAELDRLAKAGELPFFVLTANTPPSGANVLRALGRTAFGVALAQGTGGAADGWNDNRSHNGRVSVCELGAYTRELTHHASKAAGLPPQLPRLHGTGDDFDLCAVPHDGPMPLPTLPDPVRYPQWLEDAWKERDQWLEDDLDLRSPRVPRHYSLAIMRAERQWLAGGHPETIQQMFDRAATRLRAVSPKLTRIVPPAGSIARVKRKPGVDVDGARAALEKLFIALNNLTTEEDKKALEKAIKAVTAKPPGEKPYDAVAVTLFNYARTRTQPTAEQMRHLAALLRELERRDQWHAELITVLLIGELPEDITRKWPADTVRVLLEVAELAEEAVTCDGRSFPWIRQRLTNADKLRREATLMLCRTRTTTKEREEAVRQLATVQKEYRDIRAAVTALELARDEYRETRAVLADLAVNFPYEAMPNPELATTAWERLTDEFLKVRQLLTPPDDPQLPNVPEFVRVRENAAQSLRANRIQLLAMLPNPDKAQDQHLEALLRWPRWSHGDRMKLLMRLTERDRIATRRVLDTWLTEPPARPTADLPMGRDVNALLGLLRRQVKVLQLLDVPDAPDLKTQLDRVGTDPEAINAVAENIQRTRRAGLFNLYTKAERSRQAELGWAVDVEDVPAYDPLDSSKPANPELPAQRTAEQRFHTELAQLRYAADAAAFEGSNIEAVRDAAAGYRYLSRTYIDALRE